MRSMVPRPLKGSQRFSRQGNDRLSQIIPLVGYAFLGLSLVDVVSIVIPLQLTNALWEFDTIGQLVERLMFPLLGFLGVFYPRYHSVSQVEIMVLKSLSWVCAFLGLLYLLMVPLIANNMYRIHAQNITTIDQQTQQQLQGVMTLEEQVTSNGTDPQVQALLQQILSQNPSLGSPDQAKTQLVDQLNLLKQQTQAEADTLQQRYKWSLVKNALKWAIGATIGGLTFLRIWSMTQWLNRLTLTTPLSPATSVQQRPQSSQNQNTEG